MSRTKPETSIDKMVRKILDPYLIPDLTNIVIKYIAKPSLYWYDEDGKEMYQKGPRCIDLEERYKNEHVSGLVLRTNISDTILTMTTRQLYSFWGISINNIRPDKDLFKELLDMIWQSSISSITRNGRREKKNEKHIYTDGGGCVCVDIKTCDEKVFRVDFYSRHNNGNDDCVVVLEWKDHLNEVICL